jgi:LacI family transcriptional regulator
MPGKREKRPSIKDVAALAGVSTATVSHVFSGKKQVEEGLAERVRDAASTLSYAVDRAASQLRSGQTRVIAIIVPDLEDLFINRFVSLIESRAQQAGFDVVLACSRNDPQIEQSRLRALMAWRPAGIVAIPCGDSIPDELLRRYKSTPVVGADRIEPGSAPFDTVTVDNRSAGRKVVDFLLARGMRSILLVTATLSIFNIRERVQGARERIAESSGGRIDVIEIGAHPVAGAGVLSAWLKINPRPDAVVGLTNVTTLAILAALADLGLEAPRDVALVGFHDSLWMIARRSPVTTVVQPVDDVARLVWDRLERRMGGDDSPARSIILSADLVPRASVGQRLEPSADGEDHAGADIGRDGSAGS